MNTERTSQIDWRLELIQVPVADIDRAKAFYTDQAGFIAEHDRLHDAGQLKLFEAL